MRLRRIAETCAKQGIQPGQLTLHANHGGAMRSKEDGRAFGQGFFRWYNHEHHHSGIGFLTRAIMHVGQAATVRAHRLRVLAAAYAAHPARFVKGQSQPADLPTAVWTNPPAKKSTAQDALGATIVT